MFNRHSDDYDEQNGETIEMDQQEGGGDAVAAASGSGGTGGNAGDQSVLMPWGRPIYRNLSGNIQGFCKRFFLLLPVFNPFVTRSAPGPGGANLPADKTTIDFLYPCMWDFDPNRLGWFLNGNELEWLNNILKAPFASSGGSAPAFANLSQATAKVKHASMRAVIIANNAPFNTQASTQATANGQLHLTCLRGKGLSRLTETIIGTAQYTASGQGAHNVTKLNFNDIHPDQTGAIDWQTWLETTTTNVLKPASLSSTQIGAVTRYDATEGYRYYPQVMGFRANVTSPTSSLTTVSGYPEYARHCEVLQCGPGELFKAGGKRNEAYITLQAAAPAIDRETSTACAQPALVRSDWCGSGPTDDTAEIVQAIRTSTAGGAGNVAVDNRTINVGNYLF
jgi:hypothetical protein